jgi:hypothetical protein
LVDLGVLNEFTLLMVSSVGDSCPCVYSTLEM